MAKAGTPLSEFELRERRMIRRMQPFLRGAATVAGLHATCALPKCRRARQCLGCHPVDEIGSSHFKNFPPCVIDDATQAAVNEGSERFGDMMRQEALDAGYSAEQIDQWEQEEDDDLEDSDEGRRNGSTQHGATQRVSPVRSAKHARTATAPTSETGSPASPARDRTHACRRGRSGRRGRAS